MKMKQIKQIYVPGLCFAALGVNIQETGCKITKKQNTWKLKHKPITHKPTSLSNPLKKDSMVQRGGSTRMSGEVVRKWCVEEQEWNNKRKKVFLRACFYLSLSLFSSHCEHLATLYAISFGSIHAYFPFSLPSFFHFCAFLKHSLVGLSSLF